MNARRLVALGIAGFASIAAACAARVGPGIGTSHDDHDEARASASDAGGEGGAISTAIPPDFRESMTKVSHARFVSNGHAAGRFEAEVYANPAGKDALASDTGVVPAGARIVMEHFERAGAASGKTGAIMMMEKRERGFDPDRGDWRYVVVGSTGELVKDGVLESCAGCHADAPKDHLFRILD